MKSKEKKKHKDNLAQINTSGGIREKAKKKHASSKFYLNNPYIIQWPEISKEDQEIILNSVLNIFSFFPSQKKKNKISSRKKDLKDNENTNDINESNKSIMGSIDDNVSSSQDDKREIIRKSMTLGINETTKLLEIYSKIGIPLSAPSYLRFFEKVDENHLSLLKDNKSANILKVVIVCKEDIQHNILYSHFPVLCGVVNETLSKIEASDDNSQSGIRLVTLPKGSEQQLSEAAGLKRLAAIGIMKNTPYAEKMIDYIFKKIPPPQIPWLKHPTMFYPTSIIQTSNK
ncbi:hypothetical protein T552_01184 [Pneumocystis carinii B80]|uniref:Uncharacterized protein n=1 Tax=Pneumocystis carinii (strain B80) TaxID=1408658 RepID=A0A0W4ZLH6_PNEC8|nr:hypothetical protein T552_01184 [Pneumocystis carinii B80]KTW29228.1 hypothetical protein T552_01184 [Pneumocystis carinii B80]